MSNLTCLARRDLPLAKLFGWNYNVFCKANDREASSQDDTVTAVATTNGGVAGKKEICQRICLISEKIFERVTTEITAVVAASCGKKKNFQVQVICKAHFNYKAFSGDEIRCMVFRPLD